MTLVLSVLLYGSRARGDHDPDSDVDLIAVTADGPSGETASGPFQVSRYPLDLLLRYARSGDLFAFQLTAEAKIVSEVQPVLTAMQSAFRFRVDYSPVIRAASDVGWFLLHHCDAVTETARFNRRMAWCTRNILLARAADERLKVFSASALAEYAGFPEVEQIIRTKRRTVIDPFITEHFRHALQDFGHREPAPLDTIQAELQRFRANRNPAGVAAIGLMRRKPADANP